MRAYYFGGFMGSRLILPTYLLYCEGKEPVIFTRPLDKDLPKRLCGEILTYDNYRFDDMVAAYLGFVVSAARRPIKKYMRVLKGLEQTCEPSAY